MVCGFFWLLLFEKSERGCVCEALTSSWAWAGLYWGLGWIGLNWTGLGWAGLANVKGIT